MKYDPQTTANAFVNLFPKEKSEKVQLEEYKAESDDGIIFTHLRFAEMIFPDGGIMLCPISHAKTKYVGINCERIFGHSHDALAKMSLAEFFRLVHPEDLPAVQQCFKFIKGLEPYDPAAHRFTIQYRIKTQWNKYIHIRNENLAIKTSNSTYLYLMLFSNVTSDEKFYHVTLEVFRQVKGSFIKSYTYNPKQKEKEITPRQNDIAKLILKGFTNQQIADQLSVSIYTVKNHKQILFRKVKVKNSIELANYVRESMT
jgi:DNA-binding CsgD family transcriptional regulator